VGTDQIVVVIVHFVPGVSSENMRNDVLRLNNSSKNPRRFTFFIDHESRGRRVWHALGLILAMFEAHYFSFKWSFVPASHKEPVFVKLLAFVSDVFFVVNIVVSMFSTFKHPNTANTVRGPPKLLVSHYVSGHWCLVDVASSVPWRHMPIIKGLQLLRTLQLVR
jgi:hypothetical protein